MPPGRRQTVGGKKRCALLEQGELLGSELGIFRVFDVAEVRGDAFELHIRCPRKLQRKIW